MAARSRWQTYQEPERLMRTNEALPAVQAHYSTSLLFRGRLRLVWSDLVPNMRAWGVQNAHKTMVSY